MNDIRTIVGGIARLKPFPRAFHRIMQLAREPNVDLGRLADAIACDAALTANLLKDANSAYYGRPGRFETVNQAVVFLGTAEVLDLVMIAGCRGTLSQAQAGYDLKAGDLWHYSLCSALLARDVAQKTGRGDPQLTFTVGMLKDIGKIVLSQYVARRHDRITAMVDAGRHSFREAEKAVLGIDHAELGAMVATVWRFSPKLVDIIRHHHQPLRCGVACGEAASVYMGDVLCMMLGAGGGADGLSYRFDRQVVDWLQLTESDIQRLLAAFLEQMDRLDGLLAAEPAPVRQ